MDGRPIVIEKANALWQSAYAHEAQRLQRALGVWCVGIEHIGSTSVSGLDAKPVIDILVGVRSLEAAHPACERALQQLGYHYLAAHEATFPERRFFYHDDAAGTRLHHLHVVQVWSDFWVNHLLFRDYLRGHPAAVAEYAQLKHLLAQQCSDTQSYALAKSDYVQRATDAAKRWRATVGPVLETERLRLRPWHSGDLPALAALYGDPEVMRLFPAVLTREQSAERLQRFQNHFAFYGFGIWAVELRCDSRFVGLVGLWVPNYATSFTPCVEIAWSVARAFWRHGYALEAARRALSFGFETLNLWEVVAFTTRQNAPSRRLMERLDMQQDTAADFQHPKLPADSPLTWHVLYRKGRSPPDDALDPQRGAGYP